MLFNGSLEATKINEISANTQKTINIPFLEVLLLSTLDLKFLFSALEVFLRKLATFVIIFTSYVLIFEKKINKLIKKQPKCTHPKESLIWIWSFCPVALLLSIGCYVSWRKIICIVHGNY